jgi:hypothetical protein
MDDELDVMLDARDNEKAKTKSNADVLSRYSYFLVAVIIADLVLSSMMLMALDGAIDALQSGSPLKFIILFAALALCQLATLFVIVGVARRRNSLVARHQNIAAERRRTAKLKRR